MSDNVQLAVVRFVPDPVRDEPRNIGVIAWRAGEVLARFVGEDDAGDMDKRELSPQLIPDRQTYVDWVTYWRSQIKQRGVVDPIRREKVDIAEVGFLAALANATRGGFEIRQRGEVVAPAARTLDRVVAETFERLVEVAEWDEGKENVGEPIGRAHHRRLAWNACQALKRHRYQEKKDFVRDYQVTARTHKGNDVPAVFDIAVTAPTDLVTNGQILLVDAVSLAAGTNALNDVVDRARVVATKAQETTKRNPKILVRALVSNGVSNKTEAGRYATQILQDDGDLELVTIDELVSLVPKIRQGQEP